MVPNIFRDARKVQPWRGPARPGTEEWWWKSFQRRSLPLPRSPIRRWRRRVSVQIPLQLKEDSLDTFVNPKIFVFTICYSRRRTLHQKLRGIESIREWSKRIIFALFHCSPDCIRELIISRSGHRKQKKLRAMCHAGRAMSRNFWRKNVCPLLALRTVNCDEHATWLSCLSDSKVSWSHTSATTTHQI